MKRLLTIAFIVSSILFFTVAKSETETIDASKAVSGLNEFAFDLFRQVSQVDENVVLSPYSLSALLAILTNAAAENTRTQFLTVLHNTDLNLLNAGTVKIEQSLKQNHTCEHWFCCKFQKLCELFRRKLPTSQTLVYANGLWADKSFTYKSSFLNMMDENKSASFYRLDFANNPEQARTTINDWVADNTNNRIEELIPKGSITSSARLVLTNAIFFKGLWEFPFSPSATQAKDFTLTSGNQLMKPIMQLTHRFDYAENNVAQLVILPYANSTLFMAVLLPKANHSLQELKTTMNASGFINLLNNAHEREVAVSFPKFKFETTFNALSKNVIALGITDAFTDRANFSNMTNDPLMISEIIQKALIEVDEVGTVAAAATGVVMFGTAYTPPVIFNADHPFMFFIIDRVSKIILFMGQVTDPK